MSFLDELQKQTNTTTTENGAVTNKSTLNPLLDFFALAGAMRDRVEDAVNLFERAYYADKQGAVRTLFYLRDVRGGQGERELFRACFKRLIKLDAYAASRVFTKIPEYGRWDDVVAMLDTKLGNLAIDYVAQQLEQDTRDMTEKRTVSLMAKWLPSENASSTNSRRLATILAEGLKLKPSEYRKRVVALRKYITLLEQKMSNKEWSGIEYSKLPSQAHRKHVKAFQRNDGPRYVEFLEAAQKGEAKLNTSTLYTYEVFDTVRAGEKQAANAMWKNLPDYTNGTDALVVADVSDSMSGRPMSVSVSLALYFAERNKGVFHNKFMTFSREPDVVEIYGNTLTEKLNMIQNAYWEMNTNLEAVFNAVLNAAVNSGANGDDMPKVIYIISDMEFDHCVRVPSASLFEYAQTRFEAVGLKLPHVVFWNVNSHSNQVPVTKFDNNVTLISGLSQSTFRYAVEGKTPIELMNEVINSERYATIVV